MNQRDHWTREERHVLRPFEDDPDPFEIARQIAHLIEQCPPNEDRQTAWDMAEVYLGSTGAVR